MVQSHYALPILKWFGLLFIRQESQQRWVDLCVLLYTRSLTQHITPNAWRGTLTVAKRRGSSLWRHDVAKRHTSSVEEIRTTVSWSYLITNANRFGLQKGPSKKDKFEYKSNLNAIICRTRSCNRSTYTLTITNGLTTTRSSKQLYNMFRL